MASVKNEEKHIDNLLHAIQDMDYPHSKVETLVIDGGSTDKTIEIASRYTFVNLLKRRCNYSEGKNIGIANATGEIIAFLDGDCVPDKHWLKNIAKHFAEYPEIAGLGGPYMYSAQKELFAKYRAYFFSSVWFPKKTGTITRPGTFGGGNSAYKREVFEKIGTFNTRLGRGAEINSGEDVDFNARLLKSGHRLLFAEDVQVFHRYRTSFREGCRQAFKDGKDSAIYYSKIDNGNMLTSLRHGAPAIVLLMLGSLFLISILLGFFWFVNSLLLLLVSYYFYKLFRFYLKDEIGVGKLAQISAPAIDIMLMVCWETGSLVGVVLK